MATRTWAGPNGSDWFGATNWGAGNAAPVTGDTVLSNAGTVDVTGAEEVVTVPVDGAELHPINGEAITLGSTLSAAPAAIDATDALFGQTVSLVSSGAAAYAVITAIGPTGFEGTINASASGGTLTIEATQSDGSQAADFVLLHGGSIIVSNGDDLVLQGLIDVQSGLSIAAGATLTNDGTVRAFEGGDSLVSGAILNGTGTFIVGPDDTMYFDTAVPAGQTIQFAGAGRIDLGAVAGFAGQIANFTSGSTIDLQSTVANYASLDTGTGVLTVDDIVNSATTLVTTIQLQGPASGTLTTVSDGSGGTNIELPGDTSRLSYEIDTADQALGANLVRATMTTAAGTPITGAGVKIGIISDSFNSTYTNISNGVTTVVTNPEATAITDGLLPASGAVIVQDSTVSSVEDEGLAMAELVHQIAPGATIYFASAYDGNPTTSQTSFAGAVNALAADGVNIIADDWSFSSAPFFQVAGPADAAVQSAIQNGIDYFTDASNYDSAYYQADWNPTAASIVEALNGSAQTATVQQFDNGTPYQTITVPAELAPSIDLQWDASWPASGGSVPDQLGMALYNANGTIVAQSSQVLDTVDGYHGLPEIQLTVPLSSTIQQYQLAIYQIGSTPVSQFKYTLYGGPFQAQNPGGTIDDPEASIGSGDVHGWALVPGVNAVGASYWADAPAYNVPPDWTEYFSSTGPGQLLFDQNGTPIDQTAGAPAFIAPDGIETSLPGFQLFYGTSAATPDAAAVAALMLQADPALTTAQVTSMMEASAISMGLPADDQGAGLIQAPGAVQLALNAVQCFAEGTSIATPDGEAAVESLRRGNHVKRADGEVAAIAWIGRRHVDCRRHPSPELVWPVRISAHAFGPNEPLRDLFLSPDHAVFVCGALVPVKYLQNGQTIAPAKRDRVSYYHIELAEHAVILAEGLAVESYLETGDRANFSTADGPIRLFADFAPPPVAAIREAGACAPLVCRGPVLEAARRLIEACARTQNFSTQGRNSTSHVQALRG